MGDSAVAGLGGFVLWVACRGRLGDALGAGFCFTGLLGPFAAVSRLFFLMPSPSEPFAWTPAPQMRLQLDSGPSSWTPAPQTRLQLDPFNSVIWLGAFLSLPGVRGAPSLRC